MNDPWDVKSVRQSGQYISCMKISGVPLLPPVLSKECRKEMQYYKLLAKEVEKRISLLQPYVFDSCSSASEVEDPTEAPELPECEQNYDLSQEASQSDFDINFEKMRTASPARSDETYVENMVSPKSPTSKFFVDVNRNISETARESRNTSPRVHSPTPRDLPERDYNCIKRVTQKFITEKQVITEVETQRNVKQKTRVTDDSFGYNVRNEHSSDPFSGIALPQDGPSSLSSKSFTGSLNDIHSESIKDSIESGKLIRQRSYTLLKPSPQLLAHLEVHSQNTGVEMTSISMSESLSNISSPNKKRRSWDLESAKVKWSTMALELKQKNVTNVISKNNVNKNIVKPNPRNVYLQRTKSVTPNPVKRTTLTPKSLSKSEPLPNTRKSFSPVRNKINERGAKTEPLTSKVIDKTVTKASPALISESDDPAARVRELYEKIQKQQLVQMANLVEKQKKEQILLQQVFEEQNNLLFKQLKTICPKSPIEAKEAWGDQILCEGDRGPVSLSQVINYKSPERSAYSSPVSSTLNDTNNYINHCDNVLKKSRDITSSLKKPPTKSFSQNGTKIQSPRTQPEGSRTRTHSPVRKAATSRRLNYDSSASTDRDYDQILTDRTNDTLADLNVTFPSDHSDDASVIHNSTVVNHLCGKETKTTIALSGQSNPSIQSRSTENAIKSAERSVCNSANSVSTRSSKTPIFRNPPSAKERAAATKIVSHVKGYLVRRLMRTDRVQGIVQTIKDALLCALQLHQDREGIRGADVDLHRRLIQQITAACYSLHDTFVASTPAERCAMIAADRGKRRRSLASRPHNNSFKQTDIMSQSHTGSFPARAKSRQPPSLMTQSNYETFSGDKSSPVSRRYMASPRRRPWR